MGIRDSDHHLGFLLATFDMGIYREVPHPFWSCREDWVFEPDDAVANESKGKKQERHR
jgi:hypothetical protein